MGAVSIPLKLGMPLLLRRFGTLPVFVGTMRTWPATFAALPLAALVARAGGGEDGAKWPAIALALFLSRLGCLAFSYVWLQLYHLTWADTDESAESS